VKRDTFGVKRDTFGVKRDARHGVDAEQRTGCAVADEIMIHADACKFRDVG